jgi:hypothetical protein
MTLDQIIDSIDSVESDNKKLGVLISKAKLKMKSESTTKVSSEDYRKYSKALVQSAMNGDKLPEYPSGLVNSKKTTSFKEVIKEVTEVFDKAVGISSDTPTALTLAWNRVKKSTNLIDLRANLEMYVSIMQSISQNNIQEYVEQIDELDKQVRALLEYKRVQEELFMLCFTDDAQMKRLSDIEQAKLRFNLTDNQAASMFDCDRTTLNNLRKKFKLQVSVLVNGEVKSNY